MFITEYSQVIQSLYFCCRYIGFGLVDSQAVYLRLRSLSLTTLVSVEVALRGRKDGGGGGGGRGFYPKKNDKEIK